MRIRRGWLPIGLLAPLLLILGGCAPQPGSAPAAADAPPPTFNKQIVRILQRDCQECHRPQGGSASLLTFADAYRRRVKMAELVDARQMPLWKPVEGHGDFVGVRRLSAADIALIRRWVADGAPEGDPADLPRPRAFNDSWKLGRPGLVLVPDEEFVVPARSRDIYRCFVIPLRVGRGQFLSASEILPGNRKIVHHVVTFLDLTGRAEYLDRVTPGPGYKCFGSPGFESVGGIGGWAPGLPPLQMSQGVAFGLPQGAHVVMQVHYSNPGPTEERDLTRIGIHFTSPPFQRRVQYIPVRTRAIHLPAGVQSQTATAKYTVEPSKALEVTHIQAHMHLLGRGYRAWVQYPDGTERPLLRIDDWDFEHQERYEFKRPVPVPAFANIHVACTYDNSSANRRNPTFPPRLVTWGLETTDEMCEAHILGTVSITPW